MTKSGIKTEDYREITPYWIKRLISTVTLYGGRYESMVDLPVKECSISRINLLHVNSDVIDKDVKFKTFTENIMTLGYPKSTDTERILKFEHAGIEIRTGKPEWGAEPGKLYFVIKHGKRC